MGVFRFSRFGSRVIAYSSRINFTISGANANAVVTDAIPARFRPGSTTGVANTCLGYVSANINGSTYFNSAVQYDPTNTRLVIYGTAARGGYGMGTYYYFPVGFTYSTEYPV